MGAREERSQRLEHRADADESTHAEVHRVDGAETVSDFGLARLADIFQEESYPIRRGEVVRGAVSRALSQFWCCDRCAEEGAHVSRRTFETSR